jgi:hypothetical protein
MPRPTLRTVATVAALVLPTAAVAVLPHEGRHTTRQMAAITYGYLIADQTRRCGSLRPRIDKLAADLATRYEFGLDEIEENTPFAKRYVGLGRRIARKDSRDVRFCDDVASEIDQGRAELLPH